MASCAVVAGEEAYNRLVEIWEAFGEGVDVIDEFHLSSCLGCSLTLIGTDHLE